jgi:membrane-bound ClpP family serine protease
LKAYRLIERFLLTTIMLASIFSILHSSAAGASAQVILIRINTAIDYKTADLIANAATDIERGDAAILLIELNGDTGYYSPSMQVVERLNSIRTKVIAYVGPTGAVSSAYNTFVAMASGVLAMNVGTTIGKAAIAVENPASVNYLMNLMRSLATMNGRNAAAAVRMVTDNLEYSADEAYSKGVCDLKVDSYQNLLSILKLDTVSVVERKPSQGLEISRENGYEFLRLFADPTTLKYLFIAITALVMFNLALTIARPRRKKLDETHQALLDFIRTELLAIDLQETMSDSHVHETPLHTVANMPTPPSFKVSRVPTPLPNRRLERPLEVRKS